MPAPDQGDHWDFLAADLGALPPSKEEPEQELEREQEQAEPTSEGIGPDLDDQPTPSSPADEVDDAAEKDVDDAPAKEPQKRPGRKGDRVVSGFGYRRGAVDWANLARELGVEAMEEIPAPIPAAGDVSPSESPADLVSDSTPSEIAEESSVEVESRPRPAKPARRPAAGGFGAGIVEDLVPQTAEEAGGRSDTDESQEERKGRRRRRKRKPRRGDSGEERPVETAASESPESEAATVQPKERDSGGTGRRDRKRSDRKRPPRQEVAAGSQGFGEGLETAELDDEDADDFAIFALDDEDEDEDEPSQRKRPDGERSKDKSQDMKSKKMVHRGIPTWEEAVGYMVDANLESRSKRPDTGGFRPRSGRRRSGDRNGNRGRS